MGDEFLIVSTRFLGIVARLNKNGLCETREVALEATYSQPLSCRHKKSLNGEKL
jgi:hypothetical protein